MLSIIPVFNIDRVSLKTKLGAMDLHRLVCDVRRRVEHEVTFEGQERKIKSVHLFDPVFSVLRPD
jgi:hypothetical protein